MPGSDMLNNVFISLSARFDFNAPVWKWGLKFEFFNVIPNILTGMGIMGTFFGILTGLANVKGIADPESINIFIGGMKTAFITSIFGLGAALIFSALEKAKLDRLEGTIIKLANKIDFVFKRRITHEYLNTMQKNSDKQVDRLRTLAMEIGQSVGKEVVNSITGAGISQVDISDTVKEGISLGFQRLSTSIHEFSDFQIQTQKDLQGIVATIQKLGLAMTTVNNAISGYTESVEKTTVGIHEVTASWGETQKGLRGQVESWQQNVGQMKSWIDDMKSNLDTQMQISKEQGEGLELYKNNFHELIDQGKSFQKGYETLTNEMTQKFDSNISKIGQVSGEINNNFTGLIDDFGSVYNQFVEQVNSYQNKTNEVITTSLESFDQELSKGVNRLGGSINDFNDTISAVSNLEGMIKTLSSLGEVVNDMQGSLIIFSKAVSEVYNKVNGGSDAIPPVPVPK